MDRVKIPSGSVQKLETVFDDLQTLIHGNLNKRIDAITGTYGTLNALKNGEQVSSSTGLKISLADANNSTFTIQPGVALLEDGSIILVESAFTFSLSSAYTGTIAANTYYQINLRWTEEGTDPIVAMNAFFFDKAGLSPYSEKFSRWSDSYEVVAYVRTPSVAIEIPLNEIPLAIVKTSTVSTIILESGFTFQDVNELRTATDDIIDLRKDYTYRVNHDIIDDSILLFKDRDSIGANKVNGSLEADNLMAETITISGLSSLSTTNITGPLTVNSTSSATSAWLNIKSGVLNTAALIFKDDLKYRGYAAFDTNNNFAIGFTNPIPNPDEIDMLPTGQRFVINNSGFLGNYYSPSVELDLKNTSTGADGTTIKLSHIPTTVTESTIFKFGVEHIGGTDIAATYGRGYIKPVSYNRPFEFLDYSDNYVIRIDNANRKVYNYSLEVTDTTTLSNALITLATVNNLIATDGTFSTSNISYLTLSGLSIAANDVSNINLPGTHSSEFRVGVGSDNYPEGRLVVLEGPGVNTPNNFRIYGVSPSNVTRDSMSYVHLKWNWDGLDGTKQSTNEIVLNTTTTTGETLNLTSGAATIRQFYFSSSGNIYDIDSYDSVTRTITLASDHTLADVISAVYPAKIIDPDVTYYTILATEQSLYDGRLTKRQVIVPLDFDNVTLDPEHIIKLELNKKWSLSIKAGNKDHSSAYVTMLPGVYDPDHIIGSQVQTFYTSPFYNKLPMIDGATSAGTLTLTSTAYGFKLDIEGWESDSRDTSPHEFEVGYTALSGITWENSSYGTTKKSGATFVRTVNRTLQISTNQSTQWTVGVRPIQNNQPVGIPILGVVTSGGGGIVPNDSIVVGPFNFNIVVASGVIVATGIYTNEYLISGANNELWGENTLMGSVIYTGSEETTILSNSLRFVEA